MERAIAEKQDESIEAFLEQFTRFKEGRRLARMGKIWWDSKEKCLRVNEHPVYFKKHTGWKCECPDQIYRPFFICKHMAAVFTYMIGLEMMDLGQENEKEDARD